MTPTRQATRSWQSSKTYLRQPWRSREEEQYGGYDTSRPPSSSSSGGSKPHPSFRVEDDNQRAIPPSLPGHPAVRSNNGGILLAGLQFIEDSCFCHALYPYLFKGEDLDTKEVRLDPTIYRTVTTVTYTYKSIPIREKRTQNYGYRGSQRMAEPPLEGSLHWVDTKIISTKFIPSSPIAIKFRQLIIYLDCLSVP